MKGCNIRALRFPIKQEGKKRDAYLFCQRKGGLCCFWDRVDERIQNGEDHEGFPVEPVVFSVKGIILDQMDGCTNYNEYRWIKRTITAYRNEKSGENLIIWFSPGSL